MKFAPEDLFHSTSFEYYDGQHYVKTCSLCGANIPVLSEFATPGPFGNVVWVTGAEIHTAFHNRVEPDLI